MSLLLFTFENARRAAGRYVYKRSSIPQPSRNRRGWLCALTLGISTATAVAADPAAPPADTLEEITVTAQKRSESVQNVPLSITTFSSKELEQKSITDFFDYGTKVPNLAFANTGDGVGT